MVATDEVCAGIYTLLCMFNHLIKREHQYGKIMNNVQNIKK